MRLKRFFSLNGKQDKTEKKKKSKKLWLLGIGVVISLPMSLLLMGREESICRIESKEIYGQINDEWSSVIKVAVTAPKKDLPSAITKLESIERKTARANMPKCAGLARYLTVSAMKTTIQDLKNYTENQQGKSPASTPYWIAAKQEVANIQQVGRSGSDAATTLEIERAGDRLILGARLQPPPAPKG
jgi:hypothetical protein